MKRILSSKRIIYNKLFVLPGIFFLLQLLYLPSYATTKTSTGTGNWSTPGMWSPSGVPASGDDVVIHGGDIITVNGNYTCNNLYIGDATNAATTVQIIAASKSLTINGDLRINPSAKGSTYTLDAGPGTINIAGTFSTWSTTGTNNFEVGTGTLSFTPAVAIADAGQNIIFTDAGVITFRSAFTDMYNNLATYAGCTVNFGSSYTVNTTNATWAGKGTANFTGGSGSITPTKNIIFNDVEFDASASTTLNSGAGTVIIAGSVTLSSGSTFTANMNFEVDNDWTNNGGTLSAGSNTITMNGSSNVIGGSYSTSFPTLQLGKTGGTTAVNYTMNNSNTCSYIIFYASSAVRALVLGSDVLLTVTNDVTINQATSNNKTNSLSVNTATCNIGRNLIFTGTNNNVTRIAEVRVTSGNFTLAGTVTWMSNNAVATELITVSTGAVTFSSSLTMGTKSGTLSVTSTGTINFNGTTAPSFNFGGAATAPIFTTTNGCTINFNKGFTNNTNALTLAAASNCIFTGSGTVTPSAAITFGNVQINSGKTVTLAGDILVEADWINNGGTLSGGSNTVTLDGSSNVIGGSSSTTFPALLIGKSTGTTSVSYTANSDVICSSLVIDGNTTARTLSLGSGVTLLVNNDVTINQPTSNSTTNAVNVNAGICNVSGNLIYSGINSTVTRVAQVGITSGAFTLTGNITWMANLVSATEVITVSTGTINFLSSITMASGSGTIQATDTGTINFNGATAPSLLFGGATAPVLTTSSGSTVHFEKGFTSVTTSLSFASGSIVSIGSALSANDLTIGNGTTITNNGTTIVYGNLTSTAASNFVNAANATLELRGSVSPNVTINTSATGNTVKYKGAGAQTVKAIAYYNLTLDSTGTKSLGSGVSVNNNLTVQGAAVMSNSAAIIITGNLIYSSSASSTLGNNITAYGVTLNSGTLNDGGNTITINNSNGWIKNGGTFSATGTVIFGGSSPLFIAGSLPTTFKNVTVTNSGGVTLNVSPASATVVSGTLTLTNGLITTTLSNILKLTAAANSSSGSVSSYVNGPMIKVGNTAFTFPVGKAGKWMRVGASGMSTATTEVTVEYFASGNANLNSLSGNLTQVAPSEYWVVDRAVTADPVKLRFYWENASSSSIFNCTYLTIAHYTGGVWKEESANVIGGSSCANSGSGSIEMNGAVTSFSPFGFGGSGGIALPIKLVTFNATTKEKTVETDWATELEINNDYFTVERSYDGNNFTEVARVNGAGNSTVINTYKAVDENPLSGTSYYRLRQTDYDGLTSYSDIVPVTFSNKDEFSFYPNPVEKELFIRTSNTLADAELNIYDMIGNKVYANSIHQSGGTISVPVSGILPSGVYIAALTSNGNEYKEKIVIR